MTNRFDYVAYDGQAKAVQANFKEEFIKLTADVESIGLGRATELAILHLEEAYMWIGKAIRDEQIQRNAETVLEEQRSNS